MKCGEHQVTGQRCLYRNARCFLITCFTNHDNVRILTEDRTERRSKRHAHFFTHLHLAITLGLTLAATGCSSFSRDPGATEEDRLGVHWGFTDLQDFAQAQVESLMKAPALSYFGHPGQADHKVVVYMGDLANKTTEHINMGGLRDKMIADMVSRGKFRFVATDPGQAEVEEQVRFQQGSGRVDPEQAKAFGKQLGADVVVYGALRSISKGTGRTPESGGTKIRDVYYQLVLQCVNIETEEIVWAHETEMHKRMVIGLFGR